MLKYKIDVYAELKKKGYSSYYLQNNKNIFGSSTLVKFYKGVVVGPKYLNKLCKMLELQPGDIIEYVPDEDEDEISVE